MMSPKDRNLIYAGRSASITVRSGDDLRTPVFDSWYSQGITNLVISDAACTGAFA